MNAEQHVPPFRFKGFSDFWEQRKLSDLAMFNPRLELPDSFQYVDLESVSGTELINHRTETKSSAPSRAQRLAKKGDIFYQTVRPYQKNNYLYEKSDDDYVFSTGYAQLRPYEDGYFLFSRLQENGFVSTVLDHSTGTSYPAINSNDLAKLEIMVPLNLNEQQAIGKLFRHIDNAIALHQHKLAKLKELKKGYLQKLFPQNGETVPEFRFKGYSDAWEKRKLTELSKNKIGGGTPSTKVLDFWNGKLPWLQSSDINESNNYSVKPQKFISLQALKHSAAKRVPANSIAVVTRVGVGKLALIEYDYSTSQDFLSFSSLNWSALFSVNLLTLIMTQMSRESQGTSIKGVTKSELLAKKVRIPISLKEQEKLGILMKSINDLIAATQHKVDLLKKLKQGYLQKMFC